LHKHVNTEAMMRKTMIGVVLGVLGLAAAAQAGMKIAYPLNVDVAGRTAQGAIGSIRNSSDTVSYLQCTVYGVLGQAPRGVCSAYDGTNYATCDTANAALINQIYAIKGDSFVIFSYDANGYCTIIDVGQNSFAAPKAL
jgi:hypothetical protein